MNFASLFIRRPITTTLIMLGITVFGVMSYQLLPVSDLPTVDFPTIQVQAGLPGASPETMASAVALPLEKQFATIAGLDSVNSTSTQGNTSITLQFSLSRDIDAAAADVQAMIARAARQLPQMPNPPSYNKVNPGDQPVIFLALRSATLPLSTVNEYAETIGQRISMVSGVAQVQIFGAAKYAVRVDVDPRRLSARGIGIDEVASAIQNANVNLPTGTMYGSERAFTVLANGQLFRAPGLRSAGDRVSQQQPGAAQRSGARLRRHRAGQVRQFLSRHAQHQPRDPEAARHERRRRGGRGQGVDADVPRVAAAVGAARRPHRSIGVDSRVGARRQAHAVSDVRARGDGDLHLPAQHHRHDHLGPDLARDDGRHLRGDVPVQLQPRQPVVDGAHLERRLRRRQHHRDAGEHRPAHGDGQVAAAGVVRRLEGSGVHDRRHDRLAGRHFHPGPLHGRPGRPAARRVRGHHRRGDHRVGVPVDQPHADAVQPVPEAAAHAASRRALQPDRAHVPGVAERLRLVAAPQPEASLPDDGLVVAPGRRLGATCS